MLCIRLATVIIITTATTTHINIVATILLLPINEYLFSNFYFNRKKKTIV